MNARLVWAVIATFLPCAAAVAEGEPAWLLRLQQARAAADARAVPTMGGVAMEVRTASYAPAGVTPGIEPRCLLLRAGARSASSGQCLDCHGSTFGAHTSHPVDVDYASARARSRGALRAPEEAVRLGASVPGGQVRCTSCHDGASRFAHHLALPAGAEARPAVQAGAPATYERAALTATVADGEPVAVRPLCTSCHPME